MGDLKKIKQICHCNIIPSDLAKWVFLEQMETIFCETKLFLNGNNTPNAMKHLP